MDRLAIAPGSAQRIVDAIEICYREARRGRLRERRRRPPERLWFSERFECRNCGIEYVEPEPRLFSFNSPFGACPRCQGFGNTVDYDMDLVIPDRFKTLARARSIPGPSRSTGAVSRSC